METPSSLKSITLSNHAKKLPMLVFVHVSGFFTLFIFSLLLYRQYAYCMKLKASYRNDLYCMQKTDMRHKYQLAQAKIDCVSRHRKCVLHRKGHDKTDFI